MEDAKIAGTASQISYLVHPRTDAPQQVACPITSLAGARSLLADYEVVNKRARLPADRKTAPPR